nr:substrate-binding domain-containing protein [Haloechinothrix aidingensis]
MVQELANAVASDVLTGRLRPGEPAPTVRALAYRAGCSPGTAAKAHARLRDAGVIGGPQRSTAVVTATGIECARAMLSGDVSARVSGSDDPALDLLLASLGSRGERVGHVRGSVAGLGSLAAGESDAAAVHLRDAVTGRANDAAARGILGGRPAMLVHLWRREQGIVVAKGNPPDVRGVADLDGLDLVWRSPGAGSRLLLNRLLRESGATPRPQGELAESHIGVAVAVSSGAADAGLAVRSAATAVDADFVPVGHEDFELAVSPDATAALAPLLDVLATRSFRKRLSMMAGYDFGRTGEFREAT